jgi:5'-deoxynucleotidase YfbR-like HD superfamily hydrolase
LLERGKSRGIKERLERAGQLRAAIVRRIDEIADYMNWFEATQLTGSSKAFEGYLKTANELSEQDKLRRDPIASYLDSIEKQY